MESNATNWTACPRGDEMLSRVSSLETFTGINGVNGLQQQVTHLGHNQEVIVEHIEERLNKIASDLPGGDDEKKKPRRLEAMALYITILVSAQTLGIIEMLRGALNTWLSGGP